MIAGLPVTTWLLLLVAVVPGAAMALAFRAAQRRRDRPRRREE